MKVTASMTGRAGHEKSLNQHARLTILNVGAANQAAGDELLELSQPLVPTDTGALKESGYSKSIGTGEKRYTEVGYGHPDFGPFKRRSDKQGRDLVRYPYQYAGLVHFNPNNQFYATGEDNFLLKPLLQARDKLRRAMRSAMGVT